jgi:tripartite-type tricarboxylate transporter receptor subunit TctC
LVVIANKVPSAENNLKALIDHKASSFAATARGSVSHLGCVLLNSATGISARHIAYLDSASALKGVAEGVIDYACVELSSAGPSLTTRTIQAVAVLCKERFPTLPNIRTANEQGLNDFEAVNWYALFAPKGTPPAIIEKLRTVVAGALDGANVKDRLREMGLVVVGGERSTTPYLARFISSEIAKWAAPAKASE